MKEFNVLISNNGYDPRPFEIKLRMEFSWLKDLNKTEFHAYCNSRSQIGNSGDTSWVKSTPCLEIGKVETEINKYSYVLFFWRDALYLGKYVNRIINMSQEYRDMLSAAGNSFYCTCAELF